MAEETVSFPPPPPRGAAAPAGECLALWLHPALMNVDILRVASTRRLSYRVDH